MRRRDPDLTALVADALASDPRITAAGLGAYLRAHGRPVSLRRCAALLARDRPGGPPPPSKPTPTGARVWLPADVLACVVACALPGEDLAATIGRISSGHRFFQ